MKGRDYCVTLRWRNIDSFEAGDTSSDKEYIMTFLELWTSNLVDCSQSFWSNPQGNGLITGNAGGGKICKARPCWISLGLCWIRSWSFPGTWHLKKLGKKNLTFQNNIKVFLEVKLSKYYWSTCTEWYLDILRSNAVCASLAAFTAWTKYRDGGHNGGDGAKSDGETQILGKKSKPQSFAFLNTQAPWKPMYEIKQLIKYLFGILR